MSSPFYEDIRSWEDVGAGATAVAAAVAIIAAIITYFQYKGAKQIQREATAKQIYSDYLKLAIEHPAFTSGKKPDDPLESERYEWFVSYMLNACEQIVDVVGDDKEWN